VYRALAAIAILATPVFMGAGTVFEASGQEPSGAFGIGCGFEPAAVFPGEGAAANLTLTCLLPDPVLVWAVGIRLDWTAAHEHYYDRCATKPVALESGEAGQFRPSFSVPADATAADHAWHVCVEYQVNRSGVLRNDTWMSDTFSGLHVVDFCLSAEPAELVVPAGRSASVNISVVPANGFNGSVVLSAGPALDGAGRVGCSLSPWNSTRPGYPVWLFISTDPACPDRRYTVGIEGRAGGVARTASVALSVVPPPDFALNITPAEGRVMAGDHRSFMITVSCHRNLTDSIALSAKDLPAGCTARFHPPVLRPGESARLEVAAGRGAPAVSRREITVEGKSARFAAGATVALAVEPRPFLGDPLLPLALVILAAAVIAGAAAWRRRRRPSRGAAP
jgi:hypothetical protein